MDGSVVALIRPTVAPTMWTSRSDTDGSSWRPLSRAAFPMWALGHAAVSTKSGVILVGGRWPSLSVQASWDGGHTWRLFVVDNCDTAQGAMLEVRDNVVLFTYGAYGPPNTAGPAQLRRQFISVEHDGLRPLNGAELDAALDYPSGPGVARGPPVVEPPPAPALLVHA